MCSVATSPLATPMAITYTTVTSHDERASLLVLHGAVLSSRRAGDVMREEYRDGLYVTKVLYDCESPIIYGTLGRVYYNRSSKPTFLI